MKMLTDIEIAQRHINIPIEKIAEKAGISYDALEPYGKYKAKVDVNKLGNVDKKGKLILVTAITPTKAGEGKTTTTIGLGDALAKRGVNTMLCLREPSMGPVFGIKGGATGGGYAQVVPMDDINLHFTGDMHALTSANNLICACIDNHIFQGNALNIDPNRVVFKRCLDMNDRALRQVEVALGDKNGVSRKDGFNITVASEMMAILCLSNDLEDFKVRVGKCIIGYTYDDKPVTVNDLGVVGAVALLMKDAIKPNLVQTLEGTPVLMHGGPFANIAHGCNSVIATKTALKLADVVVTEAGFGADLGAEKFLDIKCRAAGLKPNYVVVVATIRALKMHGGVNKKELDQENVEALINGFENLQKHIENVTQYKLPYVVAINRFIQDTDAEVEALTRLCRERKHPVCLNTVFTDGGNGGLDLADYLINNLKDDNDFEFIYDLEDTLENKIETICKKIYGAKDVVYEEDAAKTLNKLKEIGFSNAYICMAKTPNSLSDKDELIGRPEGFTITVKEVRVSAGVNFVVVLTGKVMTMPGLPKTPAANRMNIDKDGIIEGLF